MNGTTTTYFNHTINWTAGEWRQIVLTYDPDFTRLYIDGALAVQGSSGIVSFPSAAARSQFGFSLGSNRLGNEQARGQFNDLETFNFPLDDSTIQSKFNERADLSPDQMFVSVPSYTADPEIFLEVEAWPTAEMAVLVDSTDFANAQWFPAQTVLVDLGPGDGPRDVWVGFRPAGGDAIWTLYEVVVDTVPPQITLISPTAGIVSKPVIQIKGASNERLKRIVLDLVNQEMAFADRPALIIDYTADPQTGQLAPLWQCFDVPLADGLNQITVRATDRAGNESQLQINYTLDLEQDITPPAVTIFWPENGALIGRSKFTLRGQVDDETAQVLVSGLTVEPRRAAVDRNGFFWVENLPLEFGQNTMTIPPQTPPTT